MHICKYTADVYMLFAMFTAETASTSTWSCWLPCARASRMSWKELLVLRYMPDVVYSIVTDGRSRWLIPRRVFLGTYAHVSVPCGLEAPCLCGSYCKDALQHAAHLCSVIVCTECCPLC